VTRTGTRRRRCRLIAWITAHTAMYGASRANPCTPAAGTGAAAGTGGGGGTVVCVGTPEAVAQCDRSHTGKYLGPKLREAEELRERHRPAAAIRA